MSIDRCSRCGDLVDTDNEPEAYVQIGNMRNREEYICLCRHHREQYEDERGGPDDLEMLEIDMRQAQARYLNALEKRNERDR